MDVVPKIMIGSGANGQGGGNVMEALLTLMLSERMAPALQSMPATPRSPGAEELRAALQKAAGSVRSAAPKGVNGPERKVE